MGEDLYRILQVDPSADPDVIAAAYKRLALRYHPDHNRGDPSAEEHMRRINEAYRILGKPDLRADYDARTGARLPELEIIPPSVVVRSFDPAAREINFSVRLRQTSRTGIRSLTSPHRSRPPLSVAPGRCPLALE